MPKKFILSDEEGHVIGIDGDTRSIIQMDIHHDKIHDGDAYTAATNQTSVGTSGVVLLCQFPNTTTEYHFGISAFCDDAASVDVYENPTVSLQSSTSQVIAWNNNRTSSNSSKVLFYAGVQYTSGSGNNLWTGRLGASNSKVITGGTTSNNPEWVFQSGTVLIKVVPAGTGKIAVVRVEYYEVA